MQTIPSLQQQLLNAADAALCLVDAAGTVTFANSKLLDLLGYTSQRLIGFPLAAAMQDSAPIDALLAQSMRGQAFACQQIVPGAVCSAQVLSFVAHPIFDHTGEPSSILVTFARHADASPSSPAATASTTSDAHLRALFDAFDEGVATVEVLFDQKQAVDFRFLEVNRAHHTMLGLGSEVVGQRILEIIPGIDAAVIERAGKVALTGEPMRVEEFVRSLDRWFEVYLSRVGQHGSRIIVSVVKDITKRKRREHLQAFLLKLSDALRTLADPLAIQQLAANLLGEHLQVNHAHYGEVQGDYIHVTHAYTDRIAPMTGVFDVNDFGQRAIDGYRAGKVQVCVDAASDPLFSDAERQVLAAACIEAYVAVPLIKQDVWVANLAVQHSAPRAWTATDIEAVQEVAQRTWAAVERTRAERALNRSEERYRSLFESIDEGVSTVEVLFDERGQAVDYRFLDLNLAHHAMVGLGREVVGKRVREIMPAIEPVVIERVAQVALTGQPIRFEEFISGLDRWLDIYLARVGGSDSRTVVAVVNNITERKRRDANLRFLAETSADFASLTQAEELMHSVGARLAHYLGLARCSFSVVDTDADQIECVYGWRADQAMADVVGNHSISAFLNETGRAHYAAGQLSVIDNAQTNPWFNPEALGMLDQFGVRSIVDVPYLKEGRWCFMLSVARATAAPWRADEIELVQDLAERTYLRVERAWAESALRQSEGRLQALIENLPEGAVFVVDTDLRYLIAGGEAIAAAGLVSADFIGQPIRQVLPPEMADAYEPNFRNALAGEAFEHEHAVHDHVYLTRGVPLRSSSGEVYAVLAASFDITERKRAEAATRDADQRKDEFLAMLAHELRNPLAAMSSATQVMKHLARDNTSVQRPREVIERQLKHLTRLVDDLLDMSRLSWGKINLQRERLVLATVVHSAIEAIRPLIDARGHQLRFNLPPPSVQVAGDATRLVQVLSNLLNNAAKYTDPGGQIGLHADIEADQAVIRVSDNGCGLAPSLLPHVFELFTQAGRSLDRSQGGLGVGLALVRSLVKMHGGDVEVYSAGLGQGSEFVVRLPLALNADASAPAASHVAVPATTRGIKVLVVEDNQDAADMLVLLLRQGGDEVQLAQDGLAALQQVRHFQPQVVLCDLGLPGLSGYEVAVRLRALPECHDMLLVALSGYGQQSDRRRSQEAGFDHHLTKPVDPEVLAGLLQRCRLLHAQVQPPQVPSPIYCHTPGSDH